MPPQQQESGQVPPPASVVAVAPPHRRRVWVVGVLVVLALVALALWLFRAHNSAFVQTYSTQAQPRFTPPAPPVFSWVAASSSPYFTTYVRHLAWADPATLEVAVYTVGTSTETTDYYKDKNQVHFVSFKDSQIVGADPVTFTVLGFVRSDGPPDESNSYAKDSTHVYHNSQVLAGAGPATIVTLYDSPNDFPSSPGALVLKDANAVYGIATTSVPFDPPTFTSVGGSYFKDAHNAYCVAVGNGTTNVISGADLATFVGVPSYNPKYAIDKNNVYAPTQDSRGVYIGCHAIPGADPGTFNTVVDPAGHVDSQDANHMYFTGEVVTVGAPSAPVTVAADVDQSSRLLNAGNPTITGTATGVAQVSIDIFRGTTSPLGSSVYASPLTAVTNGHWSVQIPVALTAGTYTVFVYDPEGAPELKRVVVTVQ